MKKKNKLAEGNDRVKIAAGSEKKNFSREASEGKVRPSLYLVEQFVTRCDEDIFIWKNLR